MAIGLLGVILLLQGYIRFVGMHQSGAETLATILECLSIFPLWRAQSPFCDVPHVIHTVCAQSEHLVVPYIDLLLFQEQCS